MNTGIPFDRAGGIVLPREARRRLDLQPDSILVFSVVVQRIELTSAPGAEAVLTFAPGRCDVLPLTGQRFDAAAATRDEHTAHSHRRAHR